MPLGLFDRCLPGALGSQDHRPLLPVCAHLFLHRVLNRRRRINAAQFHPGHPQTPSVGGLVENSAQLGIDFVAAGQGLFQGHPADDIAQRSRGQLFHSDDVVVDLVDRRLGAGDLEVDHRVDIDREVVLGDHRLRREGDHPLTQIHPGSDPIDERDQQGELAGHRLAVAAESLDHRRLSLRDQRD